MRHLAGLILVMLLLTSPAWAVVQTIPPSGGNPVGQTSPCVTPGDVLTTSAGVWICAQPPGAGTGAPASAAYWTRVSDATLTNESNLAALASGLVLNTTSTGVPSIYAGTSTVTNQVLSSINSLGVGTFTQISIAHLNFDPATQSELDAHTGATTSVHGIANTATLLQKSGSVTADFLAIMDLGGAPVGNRRWHVINGKLTSTDTSAVEGRYIAKTSLEPLDAANYNSASVIKPKLVYSSTAGDANTLTIGDLILGTASTGQCVQWNGTNWIPAACGTGGSGTPGGATTQVQFNDAGAFGGDAGLTYNKTTDVLTAVGGFVGPLTGAASDLICTACVTIGELTFDPATQAELDAQVALLIPTSQKDVASGVAGLRSDVKLKETEIGSKHTHTALAAANQITVAALEEGIEGSGGPVDLTSNPQIVAGVDGQLAFFAGTHATNTTKLDNGTGTLLCGGKGSTIAGLNAEKPLMRYNTALSVWEELICPSLQKAYNSGRTIYGAVDAASAVEVGGSATDHVKIFGSTMQGVCGGGACDMANQIPVGKEFYISNNDGSAKYLRVNEATGTPSGPLAPARSACVVIPQTAAANDNQLVGSMQIATTVTSVWCHYQGSAPTTAAQFTLGGMTHTAPTCAAPTAAATPQTVTAGGNVAAFVPIRYSVTNTPNPDATDTYELCFGYKGQ